MVDWVGPVTVVADGLSVGGAAGDGRAAPAAGAVDGLAGVVAGRADPDISQGVAERHAGAAAVGARRADDGVPSGVPEGIDQRDDLGGSVGGVPGQHSGPVLQVPGQSPDVVGTAVGNSGDDLADGFFRDRGINSGNVFAYPLSPVDIVLRLAAAAESFAVASRVTDDPGQSAASAGLLLGSGGGVAVGADAEFPSSLREGFGLSAAGAEGSGDLAGAVGQELADQSFDGTRAFGAP